MTASAEPTIETLTEETTRLARLARLAFAWSSLARALIRQRDATSDYSRKMADVDIAHARHELESMGVKL